MVEKVLEVSATAWEKSRGWKTYSLLALAMIVVALNRFQVLPEWFKPDDLDPHHWLTDEWKLMTGAAVRSAIVRR